MIPCLNRCKQGVLVCVGGLGMLVASDMLTDKNYPALSRGKGDAFMIIGATLYGFSTFLFMWKKSCINDGH
jgi:solute carrier family 35 protein F1/2